MMAVVFFFQAEDGIRDGHVTGVQTCALPISPRVRHPRQGLRAGGRADMFCASRGCEHELGRALVRGRMPHGLCQARALRARCRHGVLAKELGSGRGERHVRARCDAIDHGAPGGGARPSAAGGVRRGSAAEKRLVQPGNRPGAARHRDGCRLSPLAHARAHACCGTRRIPAGAPRTPARGDRCSVRSAGPALGRTGGSAEALARAVAAPFTDAAASRRRGRRRATGRRRRTDRRACRPGCGRSEGGGCLPGVGRQDGWTAVHDAPFCIGISGSFTPEAGLEYLAQADLVVAVGCSLAYHAGGGGQLWPKAKMLQIDIDPVAVSQGQEVARHHLRADARLGVEALTAALPARDRSWRSDAMAVRIRDAKPDSHVFEIEPGLLDPRRVVEALEEALPQDWEMVNSGGHCSWFFAQMPSRPQEKFLTIREFGAIGNGISFAMGVAAARPDRTVVLFDGDGSLMMHVQELETIKRHRLNILIVVMNDGAYGSELHKLRSEGMPEDGSVFGYCDFAGIARGFGLQGMTFKNLDDLPKRVAEFAASGGAAVWDFHVSNKVVSPTIRRAHPHPAEERG